MTAIINDWVANSVFIGAFLVWILIAWNPKRRK